MLLYYINVCGNHEGYNQVKSHKRYLEYIMNKTLPFGTLPSTWEGELKLTPSGTIATCRRKLDYGRLVIVKISFWASDRATHWRISLIFLQQILAGAKDLAETRLNVTCSKCSQNPPVVQIDFYNPFSRCHLYMTPDNLKVRELVDAVAKYESEDFKGSGDWPSACLFRPWLFDCLDKIMRLGGILGPLTLASGLHPRLGAESPVRTLDGWVLRLLSARCKAAVVPHLTINSFLPGLPLPRSFSDSNTLQLVNICNQFLRYSPSSDDLIKNVTWYS